jgi:parvulin-like peptidyl-prolyl isomerase
LLRRSADLETRKSAVRIVLAAALLAAIGGCTTPHAAMTQLPATPYQLPGGLQGPPAAPKVATRPVNWPGAAAADQAMPASAELPQVEEVQILALVNGEAVLASEVLPVVDDIINANKAKIPPDQLEAQRALLIKQRLKALVETKTLVSACRAKLSAEGMKNIEKNLGELFDKEELKKLYEKTKTENRPALDAELRKVGTTVEKQKREYVERQIARQWLQHNIQEVRKQEVTHEQMLSYYREHLADYEFPAKARWQQLMIRAGQTRSKGEAYARVAELGNRVLDGESFEEVARKFSEGATAAAGGVYEWTSKSSLASEAVDRALFSQRIGELSYPPIEDQQGFHIVRVLEREEAGRKPFLEAQAEIRTKIMTQRLKTAANEYLAGLQAKTKVWNIYDGEESQVQPIAENPGGSRR